MTRRGDKKDCELISYASFGMNILSRLFLYLSLSDVIIPVESVLVCR